MKKVCNRETSCQCSIDTDVIAINHIADPYLSTYCLSGLVDRPADSHVGMRIDQARRDMFACPIDDECSRWSIQVLPDLGHFPFPDQEVSVL